MTERFARALQIIGLIIVVLAFLAVASLWAAGSAATVATWEKTRLR